MNVVEPIFFQARNKPSELALAAPGTPLNLVSYARLVTMVSNACQRLERSKLRAGDRVDLKVTDPLLCAIFVIALARLGVIILSAADESYSWPLEVTAVVSNAAQTTFTGRHILVDYDWLSGSQTQSDQKEKPAGRADHLCCIFAEPAGRSPTGTRCVALTHELLSARIGRQDTFFGASIAAAPRLFDAEGCASSLGFQLLFSTLSRGASLFLMGEQSLSFNALDTYEVESAVLTPHKLLDLVTFHEGKTPYQCGLKNIFVVGQASKSILEHAARIMGVKISLGYYLTQPGMIASMPFQVSEAMNNAGGIVLPGVTVEVVGDDGRQLETGIPGKIQCRSDLSAEIYGGVQSDTSFATHQRGYVTEDQILLFED